jgi:hypothetical protein
MCKFQQPVGQGTFSVINMSNDAKIPDVLHVVLSAVNEGAKVVYFPVNTIPHRHCEYGEAICEMIEFNEVAGR